jgi:histone H3/H4
MIIIKDNIIYKIERAILTVSLTIGKKSNPCVEDGTSKTITIQDMK